ncbi:hypothetical protein COK55_06915 [Bacillus cereus]|nr:hypothetical protein COK55_06915 [Bacillus cereus]
MEYVLESPTESPKVHSPLHEIASVDGDLFYFTEEEKNALKNRIHMGDYFFNELIDLNLLGLDWVGNQSVLKLEGFLPLQKLESDDHMCFFIKALHFRETATNDPSTYRANNRNVLDELDEEILEGNINSKLARHLLK